jgi:hypothetical protein
MLFGQVCQTDGAAGSGVIRPTATPASSHTLPVTVSYAEKSSCRVLVTRGARWRPRLPLVKRDEPQETAVSLRGSDANLVKY